MLGAWMERNFPSARSVPDDGASEHEGGIFCLSKQCLLSPPFAVLVFLRIGYLGVVFLRESLLDRR